MGIKIWGCVYVYVVEERRFSKGGWKVIKEREKGLEYVIVLNKKGIRVLK